MCLHNILRESSFIVCYTVVLLAALHILPVRPSVCRFVMYGVQSEKKQNDVAFLTITDEPIS